VCDRLLYTVFIGEECIIYVPNKKIGVVYTAEQD